MSIIFVTYKSGVRALVKGLATPLELKAYNTWRAMKNRCRCTDTRFPDQKHYADKGIAVCPKWLNDFEAFLGDVGIPPSEIHSIERKDSCKGYCPENCTWATPEEQCITRSTTRWIVAFGKRQTLTQWSREIGLPAVTISKRLERGWSEERALTVESSAGWKNSKLLTIGIRTQNLSAWAKEMGITQSGLAYRLKQGIKGEDLFLFCKKLGRPTLAQQAAKIKLLLDTPPPMVQICTNASSTGQAGDTVREGGSEEVRPVDGA